MNCLWPTLLQVQLLTECCQLSFYTSQDGIFHRIKSARYNYHFVGQIININAKHPAKKTHSMLHKGLKKPAIKQLSKGMQKLLSPVMKIVEFCPRIHLQKQVVNCLRLHYKEALLHQGCITLLGEDFASTQILLKNLSEEVSSFHKKLSQILNGYQGIWGAGLMQIVCRSMYYSSVYRPKSAYQYVHTSPYYQYRYLIITPSVLLAGTIQCPRCNKQQEFRRSYS